MDSRGTHVASRSTFSKIYEIKQSSIGRLNSDQVQAMNDDCLGVGCSPQHLNKYDCHLANKRRHQASLGTDNQNHLDMNRNKRRRLMEELVFVKVERFFRRNGLFATTKSNVKTTMTTNVELRSVLIIVIFVPFVLNSACLCNQLLVTKPSFSQTKISPSRAAAASYTLNYDPIEQRRHNKGALLNAPKLSKQPQSSSHNDFRQLPISSAPKHEALPTIKVQASRRMLEWGPAAGFGFGEMSNPLLEPVSDWALRTFNGAPILADERHHINLKPAISPFTAQKSTSDDQLQSQMLVTNNLFAASNNNTFQHTNPLSRAIEATKMFIRQQQATNPASVSNNHLMPHSSQLLASGGQSFENQTPLVNRKLYNFLFQPKVSNQAQPSSVQSIKQQGQAVASVAFQALAGTKRALSHGVRAERGGASEPFQSASSESIYRKQHSSQPTAGSVAAAARLPKSGSGSIVTLSAPYEQEATRTPVTVKSPFWTGQPAGGRGSRAAINKMGNNAVETELWPTDSGQDGATNDEQPQQQQQFQFETGNGADDAAPEPELWQQQHHHHQQATTVSTEAEESMPDEVKTVEQQQRPHRNHIVAASDDGERPVEQHEQEVELHWSPGNVTKQRTEQGSEVQSEEQSSLNSSMTPILRQHFQPNENNVGGRSRHQTPEREVVLVSNVYGQQGGQQEEPVFDGATRDGHDNQLASPLHQGMNNMTASYLPHANSQDEPSTTSGHDESEASDPTNPSSDGLLAIQLPSQYDSVIRVPPEGHYDDYFKPFDSSMLTGQVTQMLSNGSTGQQNFSDQSQNPDSVNQTVANNIPSNYNASADFRTAITQSQYQIQQQQKLDANQAQQQRAASAQTAADAGAYFHYYLNQRSMKHGPSDEHSLEYLTPTQNNATSVEDHKSASTIDTEQEPEQRREEPTIYMTQTPTKLHQKLVTVSSEANMLPPKNVFQTTDLRRGLTGDDTFAVGYDNQRLRANDLNQSPQISKAAPASKEVKTPTTDHYQIVINQTSKGVQSSSLSDDGIQLIVANSNSRLQDPSTNEKFITYTSEGNNSYTRLVGKPARQTFFNKDLNELNPMIQLKTSMTNSNDPSTPSSRPEDDGVAKLFRSTRSPIVLPSIGKISPVAKPTMRQPVGAQDQAGNDDHESVTEGTDSGEQTVGEDSEDIAERSRRRELNHGQFGQYAPDQTTHIGNQNGQGNADEHVPKQSATLSRPPALQQVVVFNNRQRADHPTTKLSGNIHKQPQQQHTHAATQKLRNQQTIRRPQVTEAKFKLNDLPLNRPTVSPSVKDSATQTISSLPSKVKRLRDNQADKNELMNELLAALDRVKAAIYKLQPLTARMNAMYRKSITSNTRDHILDNHKGTYAKRYPPGDFDDTYDRMHPSELLERQLLAARASVTPSGRALNATTVPEPVTSSRSRRKARNLLRSREEPTEPEGEVIMSSSKTRAIYLPAPRQLIESMQLLKINGINQTLPGSNVTDVNAGEKELVDESDGEQIIASGLGRRTGSHRLHSRLNLSSPSGDQIVYDDDEDYEKENLGQNLIFNRRQGSIYEVIKNSKSKNNSTESANMTSGGVPLQDEQEDDTRPMFGYRITIYQSPEEGTSADSDKEKKILSYSLVGSDALGGKQSMYEDVTDEELEDKIKVAGQMSNEPVGGGSTSLGGEDLLATSESSLVPLQQVGEQNSTLPENDNDACEEDENNENLDESESKKKESHKKGEEEKEMHKKKKEGKKGEKWSKHQAKGKKGEEEHKKKKEFKKIKHHKGVMSKESHKLHRDKRIKAHDRGAAKEKALKERTQIEFFEREQIVDDEFEKGKKSTMKAGWASGHDSKKTITKVGHGDDSMTMTGSTNVDSLEAHPSKAIAAAYGESAAAASNAIATSSEAPQAMMEAASEHGASHTLGKGSGHSKEASSGKQSNKFEKKQMEARGKKFKGWREKGYKIITETEFIDRGSLHDSAYKKRDKGAAHHQKFKKHEANSEGHHGSMHEHHKKSHKKEEKKSKMEEKHKEMSGSKEGKKQHKKGGKKKGKEEEKSESKKSQLVADHDQEESAPTMSSLISYHPGLIGRTNSENRQLTKLAFPRYNVQGDNLNKRNKSQVLLTNSSRIKATNLTTNRPEIYSTPESSKQNRTTYHENQHRHSINTLHPSSSPNQKPHSTSTTKHPSELSKQPSSPSSAKIENLTSTKVLPEANKSIPGKRSDLKLNSTVSHMASNLVNATFLDLVGRLSRDRLSLASTVLPHQQSIKRDSGDQSLTSVPSSLIKLVDTLARMDQEHTKRHQKLANGASDFQSLIKVPILNKLKRQTQRPLEEGFRKHYNQPRQHPKVSSSIHDDLHKQQVTALDSKHEMNESNDFGTLLHLLHSDRSELENPNRPNSFGPNFSPASQIGMTELQSRKTQPQPNEFQTLSHQTIAHANEQFQDLSPPLIFAQSQHHLPGRPVQVSRTYFDGASGGKLEQQPQFNLEPVHQQMIGLNSYLDQSLIDYDAPSALNSQVTYSEWPTQNYF